MTILLLQVFLSLVLVGLAVVLYVYTVRSRTLEHGDRLALAPLDDDEGGEPAVASESRRQPEED